MTVVAMEVLFGVAFNAITAWSEREGYIEGYTSFYVVIGVAGTVLIAQGLLGWETVGVLALAFAGAGAPMIVRHVARYMRARREAQADVVRAVTGQ